MQFLFLTRHHFVCCMWMQLCIIAGNAPSAPCRLWQEFVIVHGAGNSSPTLHEGHHGTFNLYQLMLVDITPKINIHLTDNAHSDASPCLQNTEGVVYRWEEIHIQARRLRSECNTSTPSCQQFRLLTRTGTQ